MESSKTVEVFAQVFRRPEDSLCTSDRQEFLLHVSGNCVDKFPVDKALRPDNHENHYDGPEEHDSEIF